MYKKLILYFNRYPLYLEGESSYRFHIPEDSAKQETFNYKVKLPDGVTCSQCVIQWIYYTGKLLMRKFNPFIMIHLGLIIYLKKGNTWDKCPNGTESVGCGKQESFRNCADIAIITNTQGFGPGGLVPSAPSGFEDNPYALKISKYNASSQKIQEKPLVVKYVLFYYRPYYYSLS